MRKKIVSACFAGVRCRYDQKHRLIKEIKEMVEKGEAVPVCPEQLGGLPTPRNPAEIVGGDGADVLDGKAKVIDSEGKDVTEQYLKGAYQVLKIAEQFGAKEAILKERSPSCGSCWIYNGQFQGIRRRGEGVTTALLRRHGYQVQSEEMEKPI